MRLLVLLALVVEPIFGMNALLSQAVPKAGKNIARAAGSMAKPMLSGMEAFKPATTPKMDFPAAEQIKPGNYLGNLKTVYRMTKGVKPSSNFANLVLSSAKPIAETYMDKDGNFVKWLTKDYLNSPSLTVCETISKQIGLKPAKVAWKFLNAGVTVGFGSFSYKEINAYNDAVKENEKGWSDATLQKAMGVGVVLVSLAVAEKLKESHFFGELSKNAQAIAANLKSLDGIIDQLEQRDRQKSSEMGKVIGGPGSFRRIAFIVGADRYLDKDVSELPAQAALQYLQSLAPNIVGAYITDITTKEKQHDAALLLAWIIEQNKKNYFGYQEGSSKEKLIMAGLHELVKNNNFHGSVLPLQPLTLDELLADDVEGEGIFTPTQMVDIITNSMPKTGFQNSAILQMETDITNPFDGVNENDLVGGRDGSKLLGEKIITAVKPLKMVKNGIDSAFDVAEYNNLPENQMFSQFQSKKWEEAADVVMLALASDHTLRAQLGLTTYDDLKNEGQIESFS